MRNLMIDIETVDIKQSAGILSIAAIIFDMENIGLSIELNIGLRNAEGTRDVDTLSWWKKQDPLLIKLQFYPKNPLSHWEALEGLQLFIEEEIGFSKVIPWSNGAAFDISIISNKYEERGLQTPWDFWNVMDVRTICKLAKISRKDITFTGRKHNPIDDCIHQIKMVQEAYWSLQNE